MIRLSKSCISEADKQAVQSVLDGEFLGMGQEVKSFEDNLSNFLGNTAVCVNSGTAALHLSLEAIGITNQDEVLVQSLTYIASFQAISATGAVPISCDINENFTIDLEDARKKLTNKTKAIMPVHYSGGVGELDDVYEFAKENNLRIIEDAAHAFGTKYKGKLVGSFGDIVCFSFDGIKNITSGEGGCVVSRDPEVLKSIRNSRLLGVEGDTDKRFSGKRSWDFDVKSQGWRYHMSDIMAALGNSQLKRFPHIAQKRKDLAVYYDHKLKGAEGLSVLERNYLEVVPHIYPVILDKKLDRNAIRIALEDQGIQTGVHYQPNHKLSYFRAKEITLKNTDNIYKNILTIPLHPDLSSADQDLICTELLKQTSQGS